MTLSVLHKEGSDGKTKVIYQGPAYADENAYLVYRDAQSTTKLWWDEDGRELRIFRMGETVSDLVLKDKKTGSITVNSEYGQIRLQNQTRFILIEKNRWIVLYDVINGSERISHRFTWIMKEAEDE